MMRFFIFQNPRCRRTTLVFCRKWLTTHTRPMNCEMTVAVAAPRIPQSNWKMKMGARIMLQTTVTIDVLKLTADSTSLGKFSKIAPATGPQFHS